MTRSLARARPAAAFAPPPGAALAAVLIAAAAAGVLLVRNLEPFLARYDTLAWLLEGAGAAARGRLRFALAAAAAGLAAAGLLALVRWRAALGLLGAGLFAAGVLSGPAARVFLAPPGGFEESLLYRLRGFAAIGILGGLFLAFLALLPALLDRPSGAVERRVAGGLRRAAERLHAMPAGRRRAAAGALAFLLAAATGLFVLQDFPNSSDENSYLTQARIFAAGRLWADAPPHAEHFRARSLILDVETGRFFAKAYPGWAAILAAGVKAGAPWAVNPILSALTLALAGWAGGRLLGGRGETAVVGIILVSPFFLFNAASYYNHPAALLLMTLFLAAAIRLREGAGIGWAFLAGAAAGAALWVRPASAVALTLPLGIWLGVAWARRGRWGLMAAAAAPVLASIAGLAAYQKRMFGSILTTGYAAYDPGDIRPGLGGDHLAVTGWWLVKAWFWLMPGILAGLWFAVAGRRPRDWFRKEPLQALMLLSLVVLVLLYLVFQNKGGNEYGPRYYYDGLVYLAILLAAGWGRAAEVLAGRVRPERARRGAALVLSCGALLTVAGALPFFAWHYRDKAAHNRDLYRTVEEAGLSSALVFLATGSGRMPPGDLVRNPLDFRTGVVYARDLGPAANLRLAALYPDRPALVYAYDPRARRSTLRPLAAGTTP